MHGEAADREPSALACLVIVATRPRRAPDDGAADPRERPDLARSRYSELLKCANTAGLKAKVLNLDWDGLAKLDKVLPVIVRLKHGDTMVLVSVEDSETEMQRVALQDPNAEDGMLLTIDRVRFEEA